MLIFDNIAIYKLTYNVRIEKGSEYSDPLFVTLYLLYTENYPKKTSFFKEQNAGFSAQIDRVSLTKPGFKKGMLHLPMPVYTNS